MLTKILALILLVHVSLILFTNRALFFSKFDEPYWKDKYEHSQWKLPMSVRTLGDDGLYLYEGYRLVHGGDPTLVNAEVPPLGKYLIGASIAVFGNGHIYGLLVTTLALVALYFFAQTLFPPIMALVVVALVTLDPLITSQFTLSMLDSLQLLFATMTLLFITKGNPILAGVALGFFSETKIPVFTPILFILGSFVFWQKSKNIRPILSFGLATIFAYLLPYTQYFLMGHSLTDWFSVQKWIINFYRHSPLAPNTGSVVSSLLVGYVKNLFTLRWEAIPQWSPVWPIVTITGIIGLLRAILVKKNQIRQLTLPLTGLTTGAFLVYGMIAFWTRYLVLLLPFLYIGALLTLQNIRSRQTMGTIILVLLAINFFSSVRILFPTPEVTVKQFVYDWKYGFFQDMYEQLTSDTKTPSRPSFHRFGLTTNAQAQIESAAIDMVDPHWSRFQSPQYIRLRVTYFTRNLGPFTEDKTLPVVKENGRWAIVWKWNLLIDGLAADRHPETTVNEAHRGSILASDKTKLAEDFPSFLIWVTPGKVDKTQEETMLKFWATLFGKGASAIPFHQRLVGNTLPDIPLPMGVPFAAITETDKQTLLNFPGISLTPTLGRRYRPSNIVTVGEVENSNYFECCSYLYTTTTYDGIIGIEKERNAELKGYNGGKLVIKNSQGDVVRTILDLPKRDGTDAQL